MCGAQLAPVKSCSLPQPMGRNSLTQTNSGQGSSSAKHGRGSQRKTDRGRETGRDGERQREREREIESQRERARERERERERGGGRQRWAFAGSVANAAHLPHAQWRTVVNYASGCATCEPEKYVKQKRKLRTQAEKQLS